MKTARRTGESGRLHREAMLRTLLHRMEIAKASGNPVLVEQLEKERQDLAL